MNMMQKLTEARIKASQNEQGEIQISGRTLHEFLEVKSEYRHWIKRMVDYGFVENIDYVAIGQKRPTAQGNETTFTDHIMTVDMAKEISMLQRTERGKEARQYFIQLERAWNSPEMVMKRAMDYLNKQVADLIDKTSYLEQKVEQDKPKTIFADAVTTSKTCILVGELAKLLKQNGIDTGQKRLFEWLRENGYLIKRKGTDYNMPTQRSMEMGLFEVKETAITHSDGHVTISKTSKVTGKGQLYFINKFVNRDESA